LLFKFTAFAILLREPLGKLGEQIGDLTEGIMEFTNEFVKGFMGAFESEDWVKVFGYLERAAKLFGDLIGLDDGTTWGEGIAKGINAVAAALERYFAAAEALGDWLGEKLYGEDRSDMATKEDLDRIFAADKGGAPGALPPGMAQTEALLQSMGGFIPAGNKLQVEDAIITKSGKIIETSPNDNIIATKGGIGGKQFEINIGPVTVTTTEGDAKKSGEQVAESIAERLRQALLQEFLLEGGV